MEKLAKSVENYLELLKYKRIRYLKSVPEPMQESVPVPMPVPVLVPETSAFKLQAVQTESLDTIKQDITDNCSRCKLCALRKNMVFGEGNPNAKIMFVGRDPGADEDEQGRPFVGKAGQLLNKIIDAMGYNRSDLYIGNILKCRPPQNREPEPDEIRACSPFIFRQIAVVNPKIIVALGKVSAQTLLNTAQGISFLRGKFYKLGETSIQVMTTYHPSYLLRTPSMKKMVWQDMQKVMEKMKEME